MLFHTSSMMRFVIYGILGWCLEILWTGLASLATGDVHLTAVTYLWMFPIYGLAVFFEPLHDLIRPYHWVGRGLVWMMLFFIVEYATGSLIRYMVGASPWIYEGAFHIEGLVRLDYAPVWFTVGMLFEKVHDGLDAIRFIRSH